MCIILYESSPNYGHWTCVFKRKDNKIEHFDSYGYFPDKQLGFVDKKTNKMLGQGFKYLSRLLHDCPEDIHYNHFCYQGDDSSTCGRWCIMRLFFHEFDEYLFHEIFKDIDDSMLVSIMDSLL
jgi:hypothetical protein